MTVEEFWLRVNKTQTCWLWLGAKDHKGYGFLYDSNYRLIPAHRFSFELVNGPIKLGLSILHKCDTPSCVRPDHLFSGTQTDNINDAYNKERNLKCQVPCDYRGNHYRSLRECWRNNKSHVTYKTFRARVSICQWTIYDALITPLRATKK